MPNKLLMPLLAALLTSQAALAQPLDPDLLPPDVTLPTVAVPPTVTTPPATSAPVTPPVVPPNKTPQVGLTPQVQLNDDPDCPGCDKFKSVQKPPNWFGNPGTIIGQPTQPQQTMLPQQPGGQPQMPNAVPGTAQNAPDPVAIVQTTKGPITIRLFRQLAPNTVNNFVDLVSKGFYNNLTWHRVVPGFCIQTGCPKGDGSGGYTDPATGQERRVNLEINPRLRHNAAGVVAMARFGNDMNSASSQFYITLSAQPHLDQKYSIFGGVIGGMDTVMRITTADRILGVSMQ